MNPTERYLFGIAERLDRVIDLLEGGNDAKTPVKKTTTTESTKNTTARKRTPRKTPAKPKADSEIKE